MALAMVDFPQPDSPTSAKVSPRRMSKLTCSTAWTRACVRPSSPPFRSKRTCRSESRAMGSASTGGRPRPAPMRGTAARSARVYSARGSVKICVAGPSSTMRPSRITITRSAISATTPMSWVMRMIAVPSSR